MAVSFVAVHYQRSAHYDEFVAGVQGGGGDVAVHARLCGRQLLAHRRRRPRGLHCQWESEETQATSMGNARAAGVDFEYDEREDRPRHVLHLVSLNIGRPALGQDPQ